MGKMDRLEKIKEKYDFPSDKEYGSYLITKEEFRWLIKVAGLAERFVNSHKYNKDNEFDLIDAIKGLHKELRGDLDTEVLTSGGKKCQVK